ncbi:MAG: DUF1961 family protein [Paludibacter sp.]|nr:DUF1961 family protein [Paludibacter sp.]
MKLFKYRLILILLVVSSGIQAIQPVKLHWIDTQPTTATGVSWGVPFAKGEVKKKQSFELQNSQGQTLDLQTWPLAYWPDGSIKWLGCAAVTDNLQEFLLIPAPKHRKTENEIKILENGKTITVNTGAINCVVNKSGSELIGSIKIKDRLIARNGHLVCSLENRDKADEDILSYEHFQSEINQVTVEQSGPVRSVLKITGVFYAPKTNRKLFPFTVRLYFYAGQKQIRLVNSFEYNGNQYKDFIKSLGISFGVPMREADHNRHIRFASEKGGLWSEAVKPLIGRDPFRFKGDMTLPERQFKGERLPEITRDDPQAYTFYQHFASWNDYKLVQPGCDGFSVFKRTNKNSSWLHADDGEHAAGFALVGDVSGGLAVSLKDFWQSYPAALEINNARTTEACLTLWLWTKETEAMDFRHYDTIAHDLLATYEDVQNGLSTPYGIARTSEIVLTPFDTLPDKEESVNLANSGMTPPQLACSPDYLHAVKAFGMWSLPDRFHPTKVWIEDQLDSAFLYYKRSVEERHWYGFWNFGDVMHTYDHVRHVWRYDIGGYAWDNTELAPNNWLWYSFLRSGRGDIYRMAEAMTRHTSEVDCYHDGEMKGLGSRHNVSHWGCGSKEARIGQAAWKRFYYYLTTDERCGDLMQESLEAEKALVKFEPLRIAQPKDKFPYSGPMRLRWGPDWLALAGNWMTAWERTGDTKYRDKILTGLKSLSLLPDNLFTGPNGLSYDPESGKLWYDGKNGVTNKNHLATIMGGYEILMELFDMLDYKPFRKTFTEYCRYYSMPGNDSLRNISNSNWGDINFRTPRLTAFAACELHDDKLADRAWAEFFGGWNRKAKYSMGMRNIYGSKIVDIPNVLNPVHENPFIGTNGTAQWGLNAIMMLELIGDKIPDKKEAEDKRTFSALENQSWQIIFADDLKKQHNENWFLDGEKAQLKYTSGGMTFKAGRVAASDADHAVLWTKKSFEGNLRVDFDFVKLDDATKYVNILYLFAEGSGKNPYVEDISQWNELRKVPAMKQYYEHINAFHVSFAAFENNNDLLSEDYIRARRYLPERGKGLAGTALLPEYLRTGLFRKGIKYHITVIRNNDDIYMKITGDNHEKLCHWNLSEYPELTSGRIGLRLMGSRVSLFSDFKVSKPECNIHEK